MNWLRLWSLTFGNEGGFSSPSVPKPQPPPPPPTPTDKAPEEQGAKTRERARRAQGRASTLLAGDTLGAGGTLG